jgi:polar amino acid transport system substrate-binding protein
MYDILRERINRRTFIERTTLTVAGIVMTPAVLAGCGGSTSTSSENLLDQARKAGYIRVGFANEAPYGYADSSGKLTGEAPAVAGAIMKKLGVPSLQGVLTEFGALIPGLMANRFDMIAAGMFITPQRCNAILFSNPDYIATEALAVKAGNPHHLTDYQSVAANSQVVLGAESGAVEGPWMRQSGVPSSKIQLFPDGPTGIQALASGRVDAFALTTISLEYLIKTGGYKNLEVTPPFIPVIGGQKKITAGGYGFRKSEASLVTQFNQQLAAMQKSGELLKLVEPFGFTGVTVTGAYQVTAAQVCKP